MENYNDIINLPHYEPKKHPRMNRTMRAAQFAPFAALTGYGDAVKETARYTEKRIELNEEEKEVLNDKLQILQNEIESNPQVTITYFVPDIRKEGGEYITITGNIKRIDEYNGKIIFVDRAEVRINDIVDVKKIKIQ